MPTLPPYVPQWLVIPEQPRNLLVVVDQERDEKVFKQGIKESRADDDHGSVIRFALKILFHARHSVR